MDLVMDLVTVLVTVQARVPEMVQGMELVLDVHLGRNGLSVGSNFQ